MHKESGIKPKLY